MKISSLFARKTNPSQQPRCCHKRDDGTGCKAHPRTGKQYCFFHDPASQKKSTAARRAGGVIRGYKAQEVLKLPPNLPALPLQDTSDVVEMFRETVNHFRQGEMDLRSANCIRNFGLAMLRGFEFDARTQREAARAAAPRTSSGKKLPLPVQVTIRDIVTGEIYQSPNRNGHSAAKPPSPGQPDSKQATKENKPDQSRPESVRRASAATAQNHTEAQQPAKAQTEAQPPAKAQQPNEQKEPKPNGHAALSPAPPAAQPVSPPPKENQPVQYPPGLGPRYMTVATPGMPWWRRQQFNNPGFVTGTVPRTAAVPAPRFRGTRP